MSRYAAVISTIILSYCLGIEVVNAKEMTWNVSGNAVRYNETYGSNWTVWATKHESYNSGGPRIASMVWSRDESGWKPTNKDYCFAQGEEGKEYKNTEQRGRLIWDFADGSKLFLKLEYEISCEVFIPDGKPQNSENNFGSYKSLWDITGGAGRFAGATGKVEGSGDWVFDWRDLHSRSTSFEGKNTVYLD